MNTKNTKMATSNIPKPNYKPYNMSSSSASKILVVPTQIGKNPDGQLPAEELVTEISNIPRSNNNQNNFLRRLLESQILPNWTAVFNYQENENDELSVTLVLTGSLFLTVIMIILVIYFIKCCCFSSSSCSKNSSSNNEIQQSRAVSAGQKSNQKNLSPDSAKTKISEMEEFMITESQQPLNKKVVQKVPKITIQSQERNGRNAYNTFSEYHQPQTMKNTSIGNDQINVNKDQKNQNRKYEFSAESIEIESIQDPSSDPYSSRKQTQNSYTRRLANQISNHSNETMNNNHNFMLDQEYRRRTSYHEINVDSGRQQVNALEREYFC